MRCRNKIISWSSVAIVIMFLAVGLVSSQSGDFGSDAVNDKCILCHVQTYNSALNAAYKHWPVFDRQCTACHLASEEAAAKWLESASVPATITGTLVSQEPLWTKQTVFQSAAGETTEHVVDLGKLVPQKPYRFRIVLSETGDRSGSDVMVSSWIGLVADDITEGSGSKDSSISLDASAFPTLMVAPPDLYRSADSHIFAVWQTKIPLFGWLELQDLEGIDLQQMTASSAEGTAQPQAALSTEELHALLREPEGLAIDACNSCHPSDSLGTSHPVRIYSTNNSETRIPDDLPTVDGMLTCVTCHDPHGSPGEKLVREKIKTKLCVACHYKFKNTSRSTMFD